MYVERFIRHPRSVSLYAPAGQARLSRSFPGPPSVASGSPRRGESDWRRRRYRQSSPSPTDCQSTLPALTVWWPPPLSPSHHTYADERRLCAGRCAKSTRTPSRPCRMAPGRVSRSASGSSATSAGTAPPPPTPMCSDTHCSEVSGAPRTDGHGLTATL